VVGATDGSGVVDGLTVGLGVTIGVAEGVAEGVGVRRDMKPVVALNVKKPTMAMAIIVRTPAINDFICPILYAALSTISIVVIRPDVFLLLRNPAM